MTTPTQPARPIERPLTVERAATDEQLTELACAWGELSGKIPFRSYEWQSAWWRHYRVAGDELYVLALRDAERNVVGLAPWYLQRSGWWGRTVRFLGDGEVCSDYLSLLALPGREAEVAAALGAFLMRDAGRDWDLLDLAGVGGGDAAVEGLVTELTSAGCTARMRDDLSCWRVALADDWDQFLKSLSKSRRERTRSMLRRVLDSGRGVVHAVSNELELERAVGILVDLHQKRRHSLGEQGCFASPRFVAFHREVIMAMWRAKRLRLQWLEIEGRPAAAEYSLLGGDTVYYYQGGFEPELADERPGWLSFAVALRESIQSGFKYYDFLRGDESYKASWRAEPQPIRGWRIANGRGAARWKLAAWSVVRAARGRLTQGGSADSEADPPRKAELVEAR